MKTFETLCRIIRDILMLDESFSLEKETLLTELGCDSIDLVDIVMAIEDEFDIEISDDDLDGLKSLGDVADYIDGKN